VDEASVLIQELSLLVAGGRGVAPLLYLSRRLVNEGRRFTPLVGARSEHDLYWSEDLAGPGEIKIVTEDASVGARGIVTDLLENGMRTVVGRVAVYACGPLGMLRNVAEMCLRTGTKCQVSVETVFACGVGVCRGCIIPTTLKGKSNLLACSDGPVLNAQDVDWERFSE
jgi:dihydroorotate dehydrogenase electron transfer subunit